MAVANILLRTGAGPLRERIIAMNVSICLESSGVGYVLVGLERIKRKGTNKDEHVLS